MSSESACIVEAIFSLPREVIAGNLALLEDVNLARIVGDKITGFVDKQNSDKLGRTIKLNASNLSSSLDEIDLRLRLIAKLSQTFGIAPRQFVSIRDFDDVAEEIIAASVIALRKSNKQFSGSSLQDLVQFSVESMFGELGRRFEDLPVNQQADLLGSIRDFIAQLPQEQQLEVRRKLGINDLSDAYLRNALLSGSLASVFAGAVSIGGFGFYTGAVSLLSAVAGFVGLTLPFAFYTSLTSAVSLAANPIFFVPVLSVGGVLAYRSQNGALRERLAVNTVVQLALAGASMSETSSSTSMKQRAIVAWQDALAAITISQQLCNEAQAKLKANENTVRLLQSDLRKLAEDIINAATEKETLLRTFGAEIAKAAADISQGSWGVDAKSTGLSLCKVIDSKQAVDNRDLPSKGFSRLIGQLDRALDSYSAKRDLGSALKVAVDALLELHAVKKLTSPSPITALLQSIDGINARIHSYESKAETLRANLSVGRTAVEFSRSLLSDRQSNTESLKGKFWGLSS